MFCWMALLVAPVAAQGTLEEAAERARAQWLEHDVAGLVSGSDTIRLQLPGMGFSSALGPAQAARLLNRYLETAREIGFELQGVRLAEADHGYAEGRRRYVVTGTSEERQETVYVGFRQKGGQWRVREVRIVP
ncbi:MAG TPA: hypothetical protein VJL31_18565 [Gemmatimonadales bacterium]|jgi:hypothetical protein|nr:hypothetical protein [Gemmatimonadales bacterium]